MLERPHWQIQHVGRVYQVATASYRGLADLVNRLTAGRAYAQCMAYFVAR
jgi:hypothetical protein